jgi:tRNA (guanine37-N1)-methyltransferase
VDQRFVDGWVDAEISIGDFVVTGGELPAVLFIDSLARLRSPMLGEPNPARFDSFSFRTSQGNRLLEYPQYTRPAEFRGLRVPEPLLSGNHQEIESWRQTQAIERTKVRRPDLLSQISSEC